MTRYVWAVLAVVALAAPSFAAPPQGVGQGKGKGIGPSVSASARSGVVGQQLQAYIRQLQQFNGIGQWNGRAGGGAPAAPQLPGGGGPGKGKGKGGGGPGMGGGKPAMPQLPLPGAGGGKPAIPPGGKPAVPGGGGVVNPLGKGKGK